MRTLILTLLVAVCPGTASAQESKATTKVEGTFVVPADVASFAGRVVEVSLYKYDPRLADAAAELVEKVEIKDFAHTKGKETKKDFTAGAKGTLDLKAGYYVTLFILDGKKRTHIGECEHSKKNLCKVLTGNQPNQVAMTVREIK